MQSLQANNKETMEQKIIYSGVVTRQRFLRDMIGFISAIAHAEGAARGTAYSYANTAQRSVSCQLLTTLKKKW